MLSQRGLLRLSQDDRREFFRSIIPQYWTDLGAFLFNQKTKDMDIPKKPSVTKEQVCSPRPEEKADVSVL